MYLWMIASHVPPMRKENSPLANERTVFPNTADRVTAERHTSCNGKNRGGSATKKEATVQK